MTKQTLYLFPDTNLFIQCRPLEQLDWSEWEEFEEVHLIVCRPVQRELDNQKYRGNDRVAQRARAAYGVFRSIIYSEEGYRLVTDADPRVKLYLESPSLPSNDLKDTLDYSKPDDELVGCVYRFKHEHQNEDVRLLTHDAGAMMTAKSFDLQVAAIKDEWVIPPENNKSEREVARLKERIAQFERAEPQFRIKLVGNQGEEIDSIDIEYPVYEPMSNDAISACIQSLRNHFPRVTDFGLRESAERENPTLAARFFGMKDVYTPAADEAIAKYTDQDYPLWIKGCEEVLAGLHDALQQESGQPFFTFAIVNDGIRPGNDTLVHIVSKGNFKICPPPIEDKDVPKGKDNIGQSLPDPPLSPRGRWSPMSSSLIQFAEQLSVFANVSDRLSNPFSPRIDSLMLPLSRANNFRRDPNAFYYKPNRPTTPQESFSLECDQWRHGTDEEYFDGGIFFNLDVEKITGVLLCEIHAQNLSSPVPKSFPVEISIRKANTADRARVLIQTLLNSAK